ncbi:MAG: hypothetical protein AAFY17_01010 [Cyanobacteria bacterium J06642_11]
MVAKQRLTELEEKLVILIRTYLQRVSSKLSPQAFVAVAEAAVALLHPPTAEYAERKWLLNSALQQFGPDLSQPIPPIGSTVPQPFSDLIVRIIQYQKIVSIEGVATSLSTLINQLLATQSLNLESICAAIENSELMQLPELESQASRNDLANILLFKAQLQTDSSSKPIRTKADINDQIQQAVVDFKANHR